MPDRPDRPGAPLPLRAVRIAANCPVCGKPAAAAGAAGADAANARYRPFCSKRCADIDLGRWLKESYRVPTDEGPTDDDADGGERGGGS